MWRFNEYKSNEKYNNDVNDYYSYKDFKDFNEMKNYSSERSVSQKKLYPDYCSTYSNILNVFTPEQEEWLVELETTDKLQGVEYLKTEKNGKYYYCCLGLACELDDTINWEKDSDESTIFFSADNRNCGLPVKMTDKLQLHNSLGDTNTADHSKSLYILNDNYKKSFKEIAAIIRKNPSHYFKNFDNNDI